MSKRWSEENRAWLREYASIYSKIFSGIGLLHAGIFLWGSLVLAAGIAHRLLFASDMYLNGKWSKTNPEVSTTK